MSPSNHLHGGRPEALPSTLVGVAEGYRRWASTYDRMPNPLIAREQRHLLPRLTDITGTDVLDVACGTGRWLAQLLARGARSGVGIDVSDAMLRASGNNDRIRGRLIRADCLHLPLAGTTFDFAICSFAANHIADIARLFREIARVVRPGGRFIVSDLHPAAYALGWRTGFRDAFESIQIETRSHSLNDLESVSAANGFEALAYADLRIEAAEKPIFLVARKPELFDQVVGTSAVFVLELKRSTRGA